MSPQPLVSIVMPVYNGELYLKEAIDSILAQTFTNFEFIIINDGSTDHSDDIINSYHDDRIVYINQENGGIGAALRNGCNKAKGQYIARMDCDDIASPERLEKQFHFLETNHDYVLVGSAVNYINEKSEFINRSIPYITDFDIKHNLKFGATIAHPTVFFRAKAYHQTHGYNKDIRVLEDYVLWLDMKNHGKFHNLHHPLLNYRITNNSWYFKINHEALQHLMKVIYDSISNNQYENIAKTYKELSPKIHSSANNKLQNIDPFKSTNQKIAISNSRLVDWGYYILCRCKGMVSWFKSL